MDGSLTTLNVKYGVATIRIDNPPFNILNLALRKRMLGQLLDLAERRDVGIVVFESAGDKAFSTGFDLQEFPADEPGGLTMIRFAQHVLDLIMNLPQITVVKLQGHVLGGGACLMLACDFRVASADAKFGMPEIRVGGFSAGGGTHMLARQIGILKAREMVLLGDSIDAEEALRLGLVNTVVARAELDAAADALVARLSALSRPALQAAKKSLNAAITDTFAVGQTVEAVGMAGLFRGQDIHEGVAAFKAKRKPVFRG